MNNYSWLQQLLHRLALSSRAIGEAAFDFEKRFVGPEPGLNQEHHVFVAGLARSGTTILMRELHATGQFASLTYMDMPFVMAPNLWAKVRGRNSDNIEAAERAHGDGLAVDYQSPEAFEEVFWRTFDESHAYNFAQDAEVPSQQVLEKFKDFVTAVVKKYDKKRYLSKNNSNLWRIKAIRSVFPNASILIPFRDPLQHANSLLNQHVRFKAIQNEDPFTKNYMDWLGHHEFGLGYRPYRPVDGELRFQQQNELSHWLEQWRLVYEFFLRSYHESEGKVMFVCYETLCEANKRLWKNLLKKLELEQRGDVVFALSSKDITHQFDENLLQKCYETYVDLTARAAIH